MNEQLALDFSQPVTGTVTIRDLGYTDAERQMALNFGRLIFEEAKLVRKSLKNREWDETRSAEFFDNRKDGADIFCSVAEKNGEPVGIMAGCVFPSHIFTGNVAYDLFLYVLPQHRGGIIAKRLLQEYEEWAVSKGVLEIGFGIISNIDAERTGRLAEKLGYQFVGSNYIKETI